MQLEKTSVGKRIKRIRLSLGMTLQEFGEIFGATKGTVSKWEHDRYMPNPERLNLIAFYGQISVDQLLRGDTVKIGSHQLFSNELDLRQYMSVGVSDDEINILANENGVDEGTIEDILSQAMIYVNLTDLQKVIEVKRFEGDK